MGMPPPPVSRLTDPVHLAAKAAVASALAVAIAHATRVRRALVGFAALVCVTPTAYAGLRRGLEQLGGATIAGASTGLVLGLWPGARSGYASASAVLLSVGITAWACDRLLDERVRRRGLHLALSGAPALRELLGGPAGARRRGAGRGLRGHGGQPRGLGRLVALDP